MYDIMKIFKLLEESGLLTKCVSQRIKRKQNNKKRISWNAIRDFRC